MARIKDLKVTPPWEFVTTPTLLRVVYGNTHELVENPRTFKGHVMSHRFGMFFTINESIQHTLRYVRSVRYHLHPSFKHSEVKRSQWPFEFTGDAWEEFEVGIEIEFNVLKKVGSGKRNLYHKAFLKHRLDFNNFVIKSIPIETEYPEDTKGVMMKMAKKFDAVNRELEGQQQQF